MNIVRSTGTWLALVCLGLAACGGDSSDPSASGAPTISGTPPSSVLVGQKWSFQPSIADPDGDALTVSVENSPPWISLNGSTGYMEGVPSEGDVRNWSNIRVRVSDGQNSASLPTFSITVSAQGSGTGTATLSWTPPTERVDGSPIGELAGYNILYGQGSRDYAVVIPLDNAGLTRYVVEGLGTGTWYFAVQAVTSDGLLSAPSEEVSKTI
jgi:hypothetical protein